MLRILVTPLGAVLFLLCALLAPTARQRFALGAATLAEAAVFAYGASVWLTSLFGS